MASEQDRAPQTRHGESSTPSNGSERSLVPSSTTALRSTEPQSGAVESFGDEGDLRRLEALLTPCDVDDAMDALSGMFVALPKAMPGDFDVFVSNFRDVVRDHPLWAVEEAAFAFRCGRVAAHTSGFCPNTSQFGRELELRVQPIRDQLWRARRRVEEARQLAAEPKPSPRSDEARARGEAQAKRLRELADADRMMRREAHRGAMSRAEIERRRGGGE